MVIRQNMQVTGRVFLFLLQRGHPVVNYRDRMALRRLGFGKQRRAGVMLAQRPVNQRARGALPALRQPVAGKHRPPVRAPDAGSKDRRLAGKHMAV